MLEASRGWYIQPHDSQLYLSRVLDGIYIQQAWIQPKQLQVDIIFNFISLLCSFNFS